METASSRSGCRAGELIRSPKKSLDITVKKSEERRSGAQFEGGHQRAIRAIRKEFDPNEFVRANERISQDAIVRKNLDVLLFACICLVHEQLYVRNPFRNLR